MDDDGTITIIKTMIKANEGLPNVWARILFQLSVNNFSPQIIKY